LLFRGIEGVDCVTVENEIKNPDQEGASMSEAEEAWRLWHLLQNLSDTLWNRYESAFMDFCGEDAGRGKNDTGFNEINGDGDLPF
jgi:hypothetical protein